MVNRMKVLLVSPVGNLINGGIGKWADGILSYNSKEPRFNVEIIQKYNSKSRTNFETNSLLHRLYNGLWNYFPLIRSCKKVIIKEKFDVAHICTSASLSLIKDLIIAKTAHKKNIRVYVHCHFGRLPEVLKSNGWERTVFDKLTRVADGIIVMDMKSFNALKAYGCDNVFYLPNPLVPSVEQLVKENDSIRRVPGRILFAGQVMPTKGVYELIEACKQLKDIQLYILGHVPDEKVKSDLLMRAGNGHEAWLHIVGAMPHNKVIQEMLSCNVFVLPSYTEGFPNVIIESMACGCPIVTTPVGAIPEILDINSDTPCGLCVEPRNVGQLKDAIEKLLKNNDLAHHLGIRAQTRVREEYGMEIIWEQLVKIWNGSK